MTICLCKFDLLSGVFFISKFIVVVKVFKIGVIGHVHVHNTANRSQHSFFGFFRKKSKAEGEGCCGLSWILRGSRGGQT